MDFDSKYLDLVVKLIDLNDPYKSGHSENVARIAELIGLNMKISGKERTFLLTGSLLHDVGKLLLPADLLCIPQKLNEEERQLINKHPVKGANLLKESNFADPVIEIVKYHHERWDGTGYPEQLAGEEIPLLARITGLAEAYVSMITYDIYSADMEKEEAIEQIIKMKGSQFAPEVVYSFLEII